MAMLTAVTYTTCATSSKEQTGDIITFTQFKEGNMLTKICNNAKSSEEYDDGSIMPLKMSEEEMDAMNSGDESDNDLISTDMLENIRDRNQSHPNVNRREARYKIRDCIKQIKSEWKGALKATRNIGKGLHKAFKTSL